MSIREFMGHCFCDTRFNQLREMIEHGSIDTVLDIQRLNNELCDKIDSLIDKRKFNGKQKKVNQTKTEKPIYEFKTKTN